MPFYLNCIYFCIVICYNDFRIKQGPHPGTLNRKGVKPMGFVLALLPIAIAVRIACDVLSDLQDQVSRYNADKHD